MTLHISLIILIVSLAFILLGATLFTNGIEWLGKKLNLSEGAVGSILAAVGTALPEAMIPVIAIFSRHDDQAHVGLGAILGAPFMLSTLAFFVIGVSALLFRNRKTRPQRGRLRVDLTVFNRDIRFFLMVYALAIAVAFVGWPGFRVGTALFLVVLYIIYIYNTFKDGETVGGSDLKPLFFSRRERNPRFILIATQVLIALICIAAGARYFVNALTEIAHAFNASPLLLSLIITPVATELPEKFNSIFWIRDGKDTLALGNITGAMVFQSSLIPAVGIAFTPWELTPSALFSAFLALLSAFIVYQYGKKRLHLNTKILIFAGLFYLLFLVYVIGEIIF